MGAQGLSQNGANGGGLPSLLLGTPVWVVRQEAPRGGHVCMCVYAWLGVPLLPSGADPEGPVASPAKWAS